MTPPNYPIEIYSKVLNSTIKTGRCASFTTLSEISWKSNPFQAHKIKHNRKITLLIFTTKKLTQTLEQIKLKSKFCPQKNE